jgi:pimeloyl-ACP methyl ester carboxylesterase
MKIKPSVLQKWVLTSSVGDTHLYSSSMIIQGKSYRVQEGYILVPIDYDDNTSNKIALPIRIILSINDYTLEPIFYLGGGPGQSNMNYHPNPLYFQNRDIVVLGFRGVDGTIKLDSPEIRKAMKGKGNDLLSDQSITNLVEMAEKYKKRLKKEEINLNHFTIIQVIKDLELARVKLGYDQINIRSVSYGTRVALVYMNMFPKHINRTVMESTNPPKGFIWEPAHIDMQLHQLSSLLIERNLKDDSLSQVMEYTLNNLPKRYFGIPLNKGKIKAMTFMGLFDLQMVEGVFDSYQRAKKKDYSGLAVMSLLYNFLVPKMFVWGEMASKALSIDMDLSRDYKKELSSNEFFFGSPISQLMWSMSSHLNIDLIDESYRLMKKSTIETLFISGSIDFSTPKERVDEILPLFDNHHHVIISDAGHMNKFRGQEENAVKLILDFFDKGSVETSHIKHIPLVLNKSFLFNFSLLGKITLYVFVLMLLVISLAIYFIL